MAPATGLPLPGRGVTPAGPLAGPHPVELCYGSRLHCHSHEIDEPDQPCYRACFECKHVFRTPEELLADHNRQLAVYSLEPETNPAKVFCCPHCIHDW